MIGPSLRLIEAYLSSCFPPNGHDLAVGFSRSRRCKFFVRMDLALDEIGNLLHRLAQALHVGNDVTDSDITTVFVIREALDCVIRNIQAFSDRYKCAPIMPSSA